LFFCLKWGRWWLLFKKVPERNSPSSAAFYYASSPRNRGEERGERLDLDRPASMAAGRQQRVVVMRHGDRLDHAEPMWPANKPRPWDPPLTDAGVLRAWTVGKRIRAQAAADGYALHRVLVSPFHRCLQTAAQAVAALCAVPDDAALAAVLDSSANVPLDTSRVKVSIEYGLSEMMNVEAMGALVSQVAPSVEKWFPDQAELEAILPPGTIDHSTQPLFPEVYPSGENL
uniref:Phosphoglycerate mutase family protein n=1 Tax=Aegilops tauschii subsp. strangulata TaxID=200361 RepID=A0A453JAU8_AEGTS